MAYKLTYWEVKDKDTMYELKSIGLKSIKEVMPLSLPHNRPSNTDCILLERSETSKYTKIVYANDKAKNCSAL